MHMDSQRWKFSKILCTVGMSDIENFDVIIIIIIVKQNTTIIIIMIIFPCICIKIA